jgi:tRNA (cytidine/uridine-2'-O-)-methyltransferase
MKASSSIRIVDDSLSSRYPQGMSTAPKYDPILQVVLYQPEIPPNTGNVARSCVAIGAKLWLVKPLGFEITEKRLRRAGLDYWPHLEWEVVEDWQELMERLAEVFARGRAWFFTKSAEREYTDVRFQRGDALIFGCETRGLPAEVLAAHSELVLRIPIRPQVRSLNLSNAAAVAMYEAVRQIG